MVASKAVLTIALAALATAGPVPPAPASPNTPSGQTTVEIPAPPPLEFQFTPNSQYSTQTIRRQQRKFLEQAGKMQHSPYGSGAVPVPEGSAESGFGGRTLF